MLGLSERDPQRALPGFLFLFVVVGGGLVCLFGSFLKQFLFPIASSTHSLCHLGGNRLPVNIHGGKHSTNIRRADTHPDLPLEHTEC